MESSGGGVPTDGGIPLSRNSKSRQKILDAQKLAPQSANDIKADRIRQLKESYDLAILRAEELNRHPVSNLYQKVHSDRAKRVFSALSSLIYSTISFAKAKGLEDYIRQNAASLPASLIDLNEWEYVLQNVQDCRESMIVRSTPRAEIPFDSRKKIDLFQYLATQPIRNTKDEIQMLRQTVVEQLNAFYADLHQSMNMVLYVVEQIKDLNRKDENLSKIKKLEEEVDILKQDVINERLTGLDKLRSAEQSYELEADRLQTIIKNNSAEYKRTKEDMIQSHDEEVRLLKNRIEALNRDLAQADEKIRTRDRKLTSQNQTIQELEDSIAKEKAISKRLKDLQEADIIAVTSSLTSDMVMSQAININTYFKEFRDPQKVIQALHDFEEMKIDMEQLSKRHNKLMVETEELESKKNDLEQQVSSLQERLNVTESTLAATRTEYASEKTRLEAEKALLETSFSTEKQSHEKDTQEWKELEESLRHKVDDLTLEVARLTNSLDGTTAENSDLKTQNESLHRDNQDLRIQLLEKDNERIMALQQNMNALVAQQEELKAQLDRSNEEKEKLLKESLEKEQEKIGALQSHIGDLSTEIVKMKGNMEEIKQTNKREAEIFATEADKINALHDFAIDITTQVLEIKTEVDHLTHEKDIVMQLIKIGEIIRAETEPRVITLMKNIQAVEARVKGMQERMSSMNANIDAEHISESMKQQQTKLMTLSKNLDRLLWEIAALKTAVEEGILPHELEPNAALHAIKKLEGQIVSLQSKVISAEDDSRQWKEKHEQMTAVLTSKDAEIVKLSEQNMKHMAIIENAAAHIQELIVVIEQETANALELFQEIQLVEDELCKTQERLETSETRALALTEQIKQQQASSAPHETVLKSEHDQVIVELEEEIAQWREKHQALEETLQAMKDNIAKNGLTSNNNSNAVDASGTITWNTRRSVGFADSRNEVIVIEEAATGSAKATVAPAADIATALAVATASVSEEKEIADTSQDTGNAPSNEDTVPPETAKEPVIASPDSQTVANPDESKEKEEERKELVEEEPSPTVSSVSKEPDMRASSSPHLSSNATPRPGSAHSVNSVSSHGSKTSSATGLTARTADHYIAQQQALNLAKEVAVHMTPSQSNLTSKQASAISSPRVSPLSVPTGVSSASSSVGMGIHNDPETAIEPAAMANISVIKEEDDARSADSISQQGVALPAEGSATSAVTMDEDTMVACPGTTQGETGWYLAQGQYFYFVRDDVSDEFLLLCGPLSPALYDAAKEDVLQQPSHTVPYLKIDRVSVQATRFQVETLLQDIQERDELLAQLQAVEEENQMHQRDIGILLGKLAEYESHISKPSLSIVQPKQPQQPQQRPMLGSALEDGVDAVVVSPKNLQRQDTQEALDMEFLVDDTSSLGAASIHSHSESHQVKSPSVPLQKTSSVEEVTPEMAEAVQKLTSVARGFLARQRVQQLKMYRLAEETGVLVAMGNTTQGESGWYAGPNGQIFYFVLDNGQWIYAAGPIDGDEFRRLIKESTSLNRKLTATTPPVTPAHPSMNKKTMKFDEVSLQATETPPLLKKCPFALSGIHGDLAESGEVYINVQTLRLHLSLNVEDLMVALQQNSVAGGGMMMPGQPRDTMTTQQENVGQQLMHYANHPEEVPPFHGVGFVPTPVSVNDHPNHPPVNDNNIHETPLAAGGGVSETPATLTAEGSISGSVSQPADDTITSRVVGGTSVENETVNDPAEAETDAEIGVRKSLSNKFAEGSVMSSVMSINDDSVDSLEDLSLLATSVTNE